MKGLLGFWRLFRQEALVLILAAMHRRTPRKLKLLLAGAALYLLSPIDVVSDVVPFFGLLDDFIFVPMMMGGVLNVLPPSVRAECEMKAEAVGRRMPLILFCISLILLAWTGLVLYALYALLFG